MLLFRDSSLVLLTLDMQTFRFEKLETLNTFTHHRTKHKSVCEYAFLVPLKRRIADTSRCYDYAFAIFAEFYPSRVSQLFGVFTVRNGRFVVICEPRELEHLISEPTSIDDGQTLLGGVQNETGLSYECLLDVESGKQRPLKVDSSGRPVKSDLYRLTRVKSSEQIERVNLAGLILGAIHNLARKSLLHC